jgi:hypothetical protein
MRETVHTQTPTDQGHHSISEMIKPRSGLSLVFVKLSQDFARAMNAPENERIAEVTDFLAFLTNYKASIVSARCLFERWTKESQDQLNAVADKDKRDMRDRGCKLAQEAELELLQGLSPEKMDSTEFTIFVPHERAKQLMTNLEERHAPKFETLRPDT